MRFKLRTLTLLIGAAALLSTWLKMVLDPAPPVAAVIGPTFRFGTMPQNAKGLHAFPIRNDGGTPLRLQFSASTVDMYAVYTLVSGKRVYPVKGGAVTVNPKRTVNIFVEWETRQYNGQFRKGVTFLTNDPSRPEVMLIVEGTVRPDGDEF
jgi:hypothetical protein